VISSREVEGTALRNLGNHSLKGQVPNPPVAATQAAFLEDEGIASILNPHQL